MAKSRMTFREEVDFLERRSIFFNTQAEALQQKVSDKEGELIRISAKEARIKKNKARLEKLFAQKIRKISRISKKLQNSSPQNKSKILQFWEKENDNIKVLETTLSYLDEDLLENNEDFYECERLIDNFNDEASMSVKESQAYQQKRDRLLETTELLDNLPQFPEMVQDRTQQNNQINDLDQREENVLVPN